jgi:hypothetical protein
MAGMRHCFAIPIKDFAIAKSRLRSANVSEVSQLARTLATGVIHELGGSQVTVLCESEVVSEFALALGCNVAFSAARGLNECVQGFYDSVTAMYDRITVVHADLADPTGLRDYQPQSEVGIVTDPLDDRLSITADDQMFSHAKKPLLRQLCGWYRLQVPILSTRLLLDIFEVLVREDNKHVWLMIVQVTLGNNRNVGSRSELVLLQRAVIDCEWDFAGPDAAVITYRRNACRRTVARDSQTGLLVFC